MNFSVIRKADQAWGGAFAKELARRKRHLILLGDSAAALQALAVGIRQDYPINVAYFTANETDTAGIIAVCEKINRDFEVDLLVNYAETGLEYDFDAYDIHSLDRRLKSQFATGMLYLHQLLPNLLLHGDPRVVDIWCSGSDPAEWEKALITYHMRFSEYLNAELNESGLRLASASVGKPLPGIDPGLQSATCSRQASEILDTLFQQNPCIYN